MSDQKKDPLDAIIDKTKAAMPEEDIRKTRYTVYVNAKNLRIIKAHCKKFGGGSVNVSTIVDDLMTTYVERLRERGEVDLLTDTTPEP